MRGLIGYTGFVGNNLHKQTEFDRLYNSKNSDEMCNKQFDELVCAGISAVKWKANKEPAADWSAIQTLMRNLEKVSAKRFILISTIDVYPILEGVDESFDCHSQENHSYGTHRLKFEDFCRSHFPNCHIIRLPGLFGEGLKKNVIFDLIHNNMLEVINPHSRFQYYYLKHLWQDIQTAVEKGAHLVNLFGEPVSSAEIVTHFFPHKKVGTQPHAQVVYNIQTREACLFGQQHPYRFTKQAILNQLQEFIEHETSDLEHSMGSKR